MQKITFLKKKPQSIIANTSSGSFIETAKSNSSGPFVIPACKYENVGASCLLVGVKSMLLLGEAK